MPLLLLVLALSGCATTHTLSPTTEVSIGFSVATVAIPAAYIIISYLRGN